MLNPRYLHQAVGVRFLGKTNQEFWLFILGGLTTPHDTESLNSMHAINLSAHLAFLRQEEELEEK